MRKIRVLPSVSTNQNVFAPAVTNHVQGATLFLPPRDSLTPNHGVQVLHGLVRWSGKHQTYPRG